MDIEYVHLADYDSVEALSPLLPDAEKKLLIGTTIGVPTKRSLIAKATIQKRLLSTYGLSLPVPFSYNTFGKPFFAEYPDFAFSISHSKDRIAIGFSPKKIGLDLEFVCAKNIEIAYRFFHPKEVSLLQNCPPEEQNLLFLKLWTLKEAYVKCIGTGIANTFQEFAIYIDEDLVSIEGELFPVTLRSNLIFGEYIQSSCEEV